MSSSVRIMGLLFLAGTLPFVARMTWEMTLLTWSEGPQMLGFSMAHTFPVLAILGAICWLALAIWCVAIVIAGAFKRWRFGAFEWVIVTVGIMVLACPFIPNSMWQSATEFFLGTSPRAPDNLVYAATTGDRATVTHLLKHVSANAADRQGCSALVAASGSGNSGVISLLIRRGADPNGTCRGDTALHRAAQRGDVAAVKLLLAAGANRSAKNANGLTPADLAWTSNHQDVSRLLDSTTDETLTRSK